MSYEQKIVPNLQLKQSTGTSRFPLTKARFSETNIYPPNGEYYYFQKPDEKYSVDWSKVAILSLKQYYQNMIAESSQYNQLKGLAGLHQLSIETVDYTNFIPSFLIRLVLDVHYGSIETNGTGGAAFRTIYYNFLEKHLHIQNREKILKAAKNCEQMWHDLAYSYKNGALLYKKGTTKKRKEVLMHIATCIEDVYVAECEMNELIKETIKP